MTFFSLEFYEPIGVTFYWEVIAHVKRRRGNLECLIKPINITLIYYKSFFSQTIGICLYRLYINHKIIKLAKTLTLEGCIFLNSFSKAILSFKLKQFFWKKKFSKRIIKNQKFE